MLLPYFQAIENGAIGATIRDSLWLFPFVEAFHLVALAVIGGAVLLVDLRLLGLGLKRHPIAELARDAQPWLLGSLVFMIGSGFAFWVKMTSLALAIIFTFTIRRRVTLADDTRFSPAVYRAVGTISILLWSTVGWGGRWIGFS
jgi:hypothetical protein